MVAEAELKRLAAVADIQQTAASEPIPAPYPEPNGHTDTILNRISDAIEQLDRCR